MNLTTMPKTKSTTNAKRKAALLEALKGSSDHSASCMCDTLLPKSLEIKPHCGWYDLIDIDPCVDSNYFLHANPLTEWTQVAHGEATQGKTMLSEFRAYVSEETLQGFWTGLVIWQRDKNGYVHCPFPGCNVRLMGKNAVHTLLQRHWKYQHARPYLCNVCGSSYATDGALKVHFFRTRHNEDGRSRVKLRVGRLKGMARQSFSIHRKEAITRYIHKVERLMDEIGK